MSKSYGESFAILDRTEDELLSVGDVPLLFASKTEAELWTEKLNPSGYRPYAVITVSVSYAKEQE